MLRVPRKIELEKREFLGLSLLLMVARIEQKAHTPEQVVAGYLLGLATTTIPYFCIHYV